MFSRLLIAVIASESVLLFGAILLGRLVGAPPFARFQVELTAIAWGIAATLPLLGLLRWCLRTRLEPVVRLVRLVEERLSPYLVGASTVGLVLISLLAGIGEEALFRGVIQAGLVERLPASAAVAIAGFLFGAAHWVTAAYALLAGAIGVYLGSLFLLADNLLAPIVTHALYDFVALSILARVKPLSRGTVSSEIGSAGTQSDTWHQETRTMTVTQTHAPGTFCWADLGTTDPKAAKRFYADLFGWNVEDMPIGGDQFYTMFDIGGKSVAALYQMEPQQMSQGFPPSWLSYISVESADRSAAQARELGGTIVAEPFDVMDVGRMALIQDPTGALVALWEPRRHVGAGVMGEPGSICWNELCTHDTGRAGSFFAGLVGWERQARPMGDFTYTIFQQGERQAGGMMQIMPEWGPMPPHWQLYFAVDDCDAKAAQAESLGGQVRMPPTDIPGVGRFAIIQDPQGAHFAIIKLLPA